jgi:hypothetical protein
MTRPRMRNLLLPGAIILSLALSLPAQQEKDKKTPPEKQEKIIEEILVIGKAPKEMPVSTVSRVEFEAVVDQRPRDL